MDIKNKQELDALFVKRDEGQRVAAQAADARRAKQQAFIDRFCKIRAEVVVPAMSEFGEYLKAQGLDFDVRSEDAGPAGQRRGAVNASISIAFAPRGKLNTIQRDHAELTLRCEESREQVLMHVSAMWPGCGGSSGPGGDIPLESVTAKFVEETLTALVKQVLSGRAPR